MKKITTRIFITNSIVLKNEKKNIFNVECTFMFLAILTWMSLIRIIYNHLMASLIPHIHHRHR